jgi:hypothetical protein
VCTVLLRFTPGTRWPLVLAAVRDEFLDRPWDRPGAHWGDRLVGGRDSTAGGTWLAVRPDPPAVAALLNGVRLPVPATGVRPTRGALPLAALTGTVQLTPEALAGYDGFHLLLGTPERVRVWTWNGVDVHEVNLVPGNHIVVNDGVDTVDDPLVPHFAPLLAALPDPELPPRSDPSAWGPWLDLLRGDGLATGDPRALLVRREFAGRTYGSSSASLVAINPGAVRFDFTATPGNPSWTVVLPD